MELRDVIVNMACRQMIRERREDSLLNALLAEMELYDLVKSIWGLGHVKPKIVNKYDIEQKPLARYSNPLTYYVELNGQYVDLEGRKCVMFLGNGYEHALRRMKHVKSFL